MRFRWSSSGLFSVRMFLSSSRAKNLFWSFSGQIFPIAVALVSIPVLLSNLKIELFGVFTLMLSIVGVMSIFDFGITKSLTYRIRQARSNSATDLGTIISSGGGALILSGVIVACLFLVFSEQITLFLNVSKESFKDVNIAIRILSFVVLLTMINTALKGILEGFEEFKVINFIRVPVSSLLYIVPMVVSFQFSTLSTMVLSILIVRAFGVLVFVYVIFLKYPSLFPFKPSYSELRTQFQFGSWIALSNFLSPLMNQFDKVLIASVVGSGVIAYLTTPYEMAIKVLVLSTAISSVYFPVYVKLWHSANTSVERCEALKHSLIVTFLVFFIPVLLLFLYSNEILTIWVGEEIATNSASIFRVLLVGVFINGFSTALYNFVLSSGRSDIPAKFHLVEALIYLPLMYSLVGHFGLNVAPWVWLARVVVDAMLLTLSIKVINV